MDSSSRSSSAHSRGHWGSHIEFLLAVIGMAVGLGNVWRFPYLAYRNGGGAFLIPYFISAIIAGIPACFMELGLGQFSSLGPAALFGRLAPFAQGIGWAMITFAFIGSIYYNMVITWILFYFFASFTKTLPWKDCKSSWNSFAVSILMGFAFIGSIYYNMVITWILFYFFASFTKTLPWKDCKSSWNSFACQSRRDDDECKKALNDATAVFYNKSCYHGNTIIKDFTGQIRPAQEVSVALGSANLSKSPADEYFYNYVLELSDSFENFGGLSWKLSLCLLFAWIIIFLCLMKGVKSIGKVVYFTALFPYFILIVLLIRGVTLPGAIDGIRFYAIPKFNRLADARVWKDAATQIFFSFGPAIGGMITMASYNKFHENCERDILIVSLANCGTSIFAGFAIFSVVGFMAQELDKPIDKVTKSGPGLAFIMYPEALSRMPIGPLWSVLFFFMLITLGLDSQFCVVEAVITAITDHFTILRKWKTSVVAVSCVIWFFMGLPMCAKGGYYLFAIIDSFAAVLSLILICIFETVTVAYIYGLSRFSKDIEMMIGHKPNWYWKICWYALTPIFLMFIFIFSCVDGTRPSVGNYQFTDGAVAVGWIIGLTSFLIIPAVAIYKIVTCKLKGQNMMSLFRPTEDWGPAHLRNSKLPTEVHANNNYGEPNTMTGTSVSAFYPGIPNAVAYPIELGNVGNSGTAVPSPHRY